MRAKEQVDGGRCAVVWDSQNSSHRHAKKLTATSSFAENFTRVTGGMENLTNERRWKGVTCLTL